MEVLTRFLFCDGFRSVSESSEISIGTEMVWAGAPRHEDDAPSRVRDFLIEREDGGVESERLEPEFDVTVFIADWSDALSQTINTSTWSQVDAFSYV
jgi:hypothetical protein